MRKSELRTRIKKATSKTAHCLRTAAWQTCKVTCWIACAPCLCCALLFLPRRRNRHRVRDPFNPVYPEVPAPRCRALSLPLIHAQDEQCTLGQEQSPLMTKLPLEIRRMVYERALGGAAVHLVNLEGKLVGKRCREEVCRCGYFDVLGKGKLEFGLGLLRSCRVVYSEAIEFLYSANSFAISTDRDEFPTLDYLSYWIQPQRFQQIRDLRIHWELDSPRYYLVTTAFDPAREPWIHSWDVLSRLKGLQKLHIDLVFRYTHWMDYYEDMWKQNGVQLMQEVKKVTAPADFVVVLPDRSCALDVDLGDSRCVLKLPEGGVGSSHLGSDSGSEF